MYERFEYGTMDLVTQSAGYSLLDERGALAGAVDRPRLYRSSEHRVFGGVVAGLCEHLGLPTRRSRWLLRAAFIGLAFVSGLGLALYGAFWFVLPSAGDGPHKRPLWVQYAAGGIAAAVMIGVLSSTGSLSHFFVPAVLAVLGAALVWRQGTDSQRELWTRRSASSLTATVRGREGIVRLLIGASLVIIGIVVLVTRRAGLSETVNAVLIVVVVAAGFALITGPIWVKMARELSLERRERIRAQERSELAAHLHDSVLQTLALIQRNADAPREVARLARGQERELRTLLYGDRAASGRFATAVRDAAAEVEDSYALHVDAVVVGDAALDADLQALVQAAREAMVNAAKHAEVDVIDVYAEVDLHEVLLYVRDRGRGFDPAEVPDDRQGLRGSIRERVERHGGTVRLRSAAGEGTEIEMRMTVAGS
jgi:signal transduction histidine kinase